MDERTLVSRSLSFSNLQHSVTGIDAEMASATTFNAVVFDQTGHKLYHVLIDVDVNGTSSLTATLLYDGIDHIRETFFTPVRSTENVNGASVQLSFSVGYDSDLPYLNSGSLASKSSPSGNEMGVVVPSHRSRSCLTMTDETFTIVTNEDDTLVIDDASIDSGDFVENLSTNIQVE